MNEWISQWCSWVIYMASAIHVCFSRWCIAVRTHKHACTSQSCNKQRCWPLSCWQRWQFNLLEGKKKDVSCKRTRENTLKYCKQRCHWTLKVMEPKPPCHVSSSQDDTTTETTPKLLLSSESFFQDKNSSWWFTLVLSCTLTNTVWKMSLVSQRICERCLLRS